ncbi:MAG TPA: BrxA/BrxB family bacilliredoxin [Flavobacteriales bacterium]|nr:BrxA/BrxB family bacilliredoxin [Flavobacteriales bacterium]
MYPEKLVVPMREDLTSVGFTELKSAKEVDEALQNSSGTTMVVINSVCGCAAGMARPGIKLALQNAKVPHSITTVFAGVDTEATERARSYMVPYPPSSPAVALFKDGKLVHMVERHSIEGSTVQHIADNLVGAFNEHC